MTLYPLLMAPTFRHGEETPWGGHMLRDTLMKDAPVGATGESLEISALPGYESMVANGMHAGKPLSRMIELWGEGFAYFDLKRNNKGIERNYEGTNHLAGSLHNIPALDARWTYQIPQSEMQENSHIKDGEQNP